MLASNAANLHLEKIEFALMARCPGFESDFKCAEGFLQPAVISARHLIQALMQHFFLGRQDIYNI